MCTSITITTKNNDTILGRTFDWIPLDRPAKITFVPRNFNWISKTSSESFNSKFALMGLSLNQSDSRNHPILADGVNEMGLMCACLWINDASYSSFKKDKHNLRAADVVFGMLSEFSSVDDVLHNLSSLNIFNPETSQFEDDLLLHWILNDKSGKSIIVEQTKLGLQIYSNSIGTLTNDPIYPKHLCNLYDYLPYDSKIFEDARLPGDFSPSSRFIRAALLRQSITKASNESEGIRDTFKVLENVSSKDEAFMFYTLYRTAMRANSGNYYAITYGNNQIDKFNLFHENLNGKNIVEYELSETQAFNIRN
ncbi:MAG: linear amide C-N hydrolase [Clostridium sp.]|nr:linear amide C-N hydrolase [Clostridium sp.]